MKIRNWFISGVLGLFAIAFLVPLFASAQEPVDISELIEEVSTDSQKDAFAGYSYKMEFVRRRPAIFGTATLTRRYEAILPFTVPKNRRYSHPMLLTYDSSRNLSSADIKSERTRIVKKLEGLETRNEDTAAIRKTKENAGGYVALRAEGVTVDKRNLKIDLVGLLRNSDFSNQRQILVNERETIVLDFHPLPDLTYETELFYLAFLEGTIYIDKLEKRIVAVEGFPVGKFEGIRNLPQAARAEKSVFYYTQTRVPEGYWFPDKVKLNFIGSSPEFNGLDVQVEFFFSEYKRVYVRVDSAEVDPLNGN